MSLRNGGKIDYRKLAKLAESAFSTYINPECDGKSLAGGNSKAYGARKSDGEWQLKQGQSAENDLCAKVACSEAVEVG